MNLRILFTLLGIFFIDALLLAQSNFITRWQLPSGQNSLRFHTAAATAVSYTWTTVPAGTSGSGTFTAGLQTTISGLPDNSVIELSMSPNLTRFFLTVGTTAELDSDKLIDVVQWGTAQWSSMMNMFSNAVNLNNITATDLPDLSQAVSAEYMFNNCTNLNGPANIGNWDVSNITNFSYMFKNALSFNSPIGNWRFGSAITNLRYMFENAAAFNRDISDWNIEQVNNLSYMFSGASSFNRDIGSWNTVNVNRMDGMFWNASSFNQDISNWSTANVTNMTGMFENAAAFNRSLATWNLNSLKSASSMFKDSGLDCESYSETLIGWNNNSNTPDSVNFIFNNNMRYGTNAVADRDDLINNKKWNISGDFPSGNDCSAVLSAEIQELYHISLYPNPASDILFIKGYSGSFRIFNAAGKLLSAEMQLNGDGSVDISSFKPGFYFIQTEKGTLKFLKI
jgi:surface protein